MPYHQGNIRQAKFHQQKLAVYKADYLFNYSTTLMHSVLRSLTSISNALCCCLDVHSKHA